MSQGTEDRPRALVSNGYARAHRGAMVGLAFSLARITSRDGTCMNPQQRSIDISASDRAAALERHVRYRIGGQVSGFGVRILNEKVILRGRAKTFYAKQLAQHAVMEATDLPVLANEIEVCSTG